MLRRFIPALSLVSVLALAACRPAAPSASPLETMTVRAVSVEVGVGSPIPVDAFISGELPNTCAQLGEVQQRLEGKSFNLTLKTFTLPGEGCVADTLPFRLAVPLNIVGLPEGTYTVAVNDQATAEFQLPLR